jgi:hypothetical protein
MPAQFVPLIGDHSTFQQTLRRITDPNLFARPITNAEFRFVVVAQFRASGLAADIALEPARRDCGRDLRHPAIGAGDELRLPAAARRRDGARRRGIKDSEFNTQLCRERQRPSQLAALTNRLVLRWNALLLSPQCR